MFDLLLNGAEEITASALAILGLFLAIPGAIKCFFGYRVLKLYITVIGFLAGLLGFSSSAPSPSGHWAPACWWGCWAEC